LADFTYKDKPRMATRGFLTRRFREIEADQAERLVIDIRHYDRRADRRATLTGRNTMERPK